MKTCPLFALLPLLIPLYASSQVVLVKDTSISAEFKFDLLLENTTKDAEWIARRKVYSLTDELKAALADVGSWEEGYEYCQVLKTLRESCRP